MKSNLLLRILYYIYIILLIVELGRIKWHLMGSWECLWLRGMFSAPQHKTMVLHFCFTLFIIWSADSSVPSTRGSTTKTWLCVYLFGSCSWTLWTSSPRCSTSATRPSWFSPSGSWRAQSAFMRHTRSYTRFMPLSRLTEPSPVVHSYFLWILMCFCCCCCSLKQVNSGLLLRGWKTGKKRDP